LSIKAPQVQSLESIRSQMVEMLVKMAGKGSLIGQEPPASGRVVSPRQTSTPQIPASIVRVLVNLAEGGIPLHVLNLADTGTKGSHIDAYAATKDTSSSKMQVVSALIGAVDGGLVTADELNAFLTLFAVPSELVQKALAEAGGDTDNETVTLNDSLYRLVSGRLVAANPRRADETSRLWLNTAVVATALLLLAVAVMRFS